MTTPPSYNPNYGPYTTPPPPPSGGPAHASKTPWWKHTWVLVVAVALFASGIGYGAGGGDPKTTTKTVAGPATTLTATATETAATPAPVTRTATVTGHPIKVIATRTHIKRVTFTPQPKRSITDGTYLVGRDIRPGLYQTDGDGDCYWARLQNLRGDLNAILANDNIAGPTTVEVQSGDKAFEVSGGCEWHDRVN